MQGKKWLVPVGLVLLLLLALGTYLTYSLPHYRGHSARFWLQQTNTLHAAAYPPFMFLENGKEAIPFQAMGSRGVRFLAKQLSNSDQSKYSRFFSRLPTWMKVRWLAPKNSIHARRKAAFLLAYLGTNSQPAYRQIVAYLKDQKIQDYEEKAILTQLLPSICPSFEQGVQDLTVIFEEARAHPVKLSALISLGRFLGEDLFHEVWPDPNVPLQSPGFPKEVAFRILTENLYEKTYRQNLALMLVPNHQGEIYDLLLKDDVVDHPSYAKKVRTFINLYSVVFEAHPMFPLVPTTTKNTMQLRNYLKDAEFVVQYQAARGLVLMDQKAWPEVLPIFLQAREKNKTKFAGEFPKLLEKTSPLPSEQLAELEKLSPQPSASEGHQEIIQALKDHSRQLQLKLAQERKTIEPLFASTQIRYFPIGRMVRIPVPSPAWHVDNSKSVSSLFPTNLIPPNHPLPFFSRVPIIRARNGIYPHLGSFDANLGLNRTSLKRGDTLTLYLAIQVNDGGQMKSISSFSQSEVLALLPFGFEPVGDWKSTSQKGNYTGRVLLERTYRNVSAHPGRYQSLLMLRLEPFDKQHVEEKTFGLSLTIE